MKTKNRTSAIWSIGKEQLEKIVKESTSFSSILSYFGLKNKGGNNKTLKTRCLEDGIDFSHINSSHLSNKGRKFPHKALSKEKCIEIVFIKNSTRSRNSVKMYLLKYNLIPYICECGNDGNWREKKLSLQIDHINGESDDHRLENLRWICPNCHAQTETFTGKHKKIKHKIKPSFLNPEWRKQSKLKSRKVEWPSKEILEKLVWERPTEHLAKEFGVSGNAIYKWCKRYNISKPPRGYWSKK